MSIEPLTDMSHSSRDLRWGLYPGREGFLAVELLCILPSGGTHLARLRAFAEGHPDVRMLAGHMWRSFFDSQAAG